MKITVVTVCYNAASELEETILSVLNQDYADIEYIIIDGGSTDGSVDIIRKYADRLAYRVSEPDKGIYDAMNKGIAAATGDYINFMNAGDRFTGPTVLTDLCKALGNERPEIIYGDVIVKEKRIEYLLRPKVIEKIMPDRLPFCHQSAFVATKYHQQHPFDITFKCAADYNMFYQAYFKFDARFKYVPVVIAIYDESTGFSKANMKLTHRERYRVWGIENDKLKIFSHEISLRYRQLKMSIKNILPLGLLRRYKK